MEKGIHELIKRSKLPSESLIELLSKTLIGTEGTRYQLIDTPKKIQKLNNATHIYLERNGRVLGNATFCKRQIRLNQDYELAYYIRYVAFERLFQSGAKLSNGNSKLHRYFRELCSTSNLNLQSSEFKRSIYYAYIDPQNLRSFNLNRALGFESIGYFKTTVFSRLRPKKQEVSLLTKNELNFVSKLSDEFYADHSFYDQKSPLETSNFYVLKLDGEIIAGIRANPVHWKIKELPGFTGHFLVKIGPYIPLLRKLINAKNYRFLATEGLFWKKGHEAFVTDLLEGVLYQTGQNSLLLWTDNHSDLLNQLHVRWGFIQKIKQDSEVHIVAKLNHYTAAEKNDLINSKKYIRGFDVT